MTAAKTRSNSSVKSFASGLPKQLQILPRHDARSIGRLSDSSMLSLDDIDVRYGETPADHSLDYAVAYINRQASRLTMGNLTDQRVAKVLVRSANAVDQVMMACAATIQKQRKQRRRGLQFGSRSAQKAKLSRLADSSTSSMAVADDELTLLDVLGVL